jgi:hypothetical protein
MTTLDSKDQYATLINTFAVEPERAEQLLEILSRVTQETMRQQAAAIATNYTPILYELRHVHAAERAP